MAAKVVAQFFETHPQHEGGCYDKYVVTDGTGRKWTLMSDSSIACTHKNGVAASRSYSVEFVSPICTYGDIPVIQQLVRDLRAAGGVPRGQILARDTPHLDSIQTRFGACNSSTGIHIHINAEPYNALKLRNLVNIVASKEDIIYDALQVGMSRAHYCKKVDRSFLQKLNAAKPRTMDEIKDIWYDGRDGSNYHYHDSRYHLLNLHSMFSKGTVEFRAFNSTLHAGVIRSYLVFCRTPAEGRPARLTFGCSVCLAISNQALSQKSAQWKPTHSPNQKYTFRTWLLRLGLIGEEFKNCRKHLLSHLEGNIAWLHPEDAIAQRERLKQERIAARSQAVEQQAPCEPAVAAVCNVPEEVRETPHENLQGVVSDCEEFDETEEMSMTM